MKKKVMFSETAYVLGVLLLTLGTAFMEKADFGLSMVTAPAYIIHLKVSEVLTFYSFGMSGYVLQAVLLAVMAALLRKFRPAYLFAFITAVVFGFVLDGWMLLTAFIPADSFAVRAVLYAAGMLLCSAGVAMMFKTYLAPEVYDLFVKEVSAKFGIRLSKFKTCYDLASCTVSVGLSFLFFGLWQFEGVKLGTVICAFLNGWLIGRFSGLYGRLWDFRDKLPFRKYFE